ncbi:MAG: PD-(D/E)XK nuclease family protein [Spartobacteria bacterium]|nr:PD-(D/E)XK nuclease family protein [Spartobacteria bacterium]
MKIFFDWVMPALDQAVDFFTVDRGSGVLDLSDQMIIVPTTHAGRRLRERLALRVAENSGKGKGAVLPGIVGEADILLRKTGTSRLAVANGMTAKWAFMSCMKEWRQADDQHISAVFPQGWPDDDSLLGFADEFSRLRSMLCDEGHTVASFAEGLEDDHPEYERWRVLARWEDLLITELEKHGVSDASTTRLAQAIDPGIPEGISRIVVLFVADLSPLSVMALEKWAKKLPVVICIHAPESMCDGFDEWGRPDRTYWEKRSIPLENDWIELSAEPSEQLNRIADIVDASGTGAALGVPQSDLIPYLRNQLKNKGIHGFDPGGITARLVSLYQVILGLLDLSAQAEYEQVASLLRGADLVAYFESTVPDCSQKRLFEELAGFQNKHLPLDLAAITTLLQTHGETYTLLNAVICQLNDWVERIRDHGITTQIPAILSEIYTNKTLSPLTNSEDAAFAALAGWISELLGELRDLSAIWPMGHHIKRVARHELTRCMLKSERPAGRTIDLLGWVELHWEDAPLLLIAGMNDGAVPTDVVGHIFLGDTLRKEMNIRDNRFYLARDVYLMSAILASHDAGCVRMFLSKTGLGGRDPLKPSRLLLRESDDEKLAHRVQWLFREVHSEQSAVKRDGLRRMQLPSPDTLLPLDHLQVTDLASYVRSPFNFYLERRLGMRRLHDQKMEMDAMDFGSLAHGIMQDFAESTQRSSDDAEDIDACLSALLDQTMHFIYGANWSLPIELQWLALKERLHYAAKIQANSVREGWNIIAAEIPFEAEIGGIRLTGRIDRIDEHKDGRLRIIDYKTSDKAVGPADHHRKKGKEEPRWTDFQLPIYYAAYKKKHPEKIIECGYFVLPKAVADTNILLWDDINSETACALEEAENVVTQIRKGIFWPPRRLSSDLEPLFCRSPEEMFDEAALRQLGKS